MRTALLAALVATVAHAAPPELGYAQATGYFKKDTRPTQYQPLNLVDGKEATAWCSSGPDPLVERLTFGFKEDVKVDEVRVFTGNGADEASWKGFARAKKLSVKGLAGGAVLNLSDERGLQAVAIKPAIDAAELTVEVLDLFPADDLDQPTCLSELVFYSEGKPVGATAAAKARFDKQLAPLWGTWFSGSPGAPTYFLSLYVDGSWRFAHEPWGEPRDARRVVGTYESTGSSVALSWPGGAKAALRHELKKNGEPALSVDGAAPEELRRAWRAHP